MTELNRSKSREIIMTALYQIYIYKNNNVEYELDDVIKALVTIENNFISDLVKGVLEKEEKLDLIINKNMTKWKIERLSKTDQAILRTATYEMFFTDTPDVVCINEAIELSKKYSDEKAKNLINGVLDSILKEKENTDY